MNYNGNENIILLMNNHDHHHYWKLMKLKYFFSLNVGSNPRINPVCVGGCVCQFVWLKIMMIMAITHHATTLYIIFWFQMIHIINLMMMMIISIICWIRMVNQNEKKGFKFNQKNKRKTIMNLIRKNVIHLSIFLL